MAACCQCSRWLADLCSLSPARVCIDSSLSLSVSTRMVWRKTSSETMLVGGEEMLMEGDDADVREREGMRGAASDAGEGDTSNEVT